MNNENIAVIGLGCRFPGGVTNAKSYWKLLSTGSDAIIDVPDDRWDIRKFYDANPNKPGKTYAKQGGYLKEPIDTFDPLFFSISPREAEVMDPQQRFLLEVTWEAFEDAGLKASDLAGSKTGVFIGGFCLDNLVQKMSVFNRDQTSVSTSTGVTMTMLSNRLSYIFDLRGPSFTLDTACSSSLVAIHQACSSIWSGESTMALAGGVNIMSRPEYPIMMSKGKFLSEHCRSKAFDADAQGYSRGEGAGVVILKPLKQALLDGDNIHAVVKASGINQDGRTVGIALPNPEAQESLIREVYKKANITGADVDYIEAHGTGTQAGDPAEIGALDKVLSETRDKNNKCWVGSVKTNIGHLEASAGVAGFIKALLCLKHKKIPANLHFKNPNPKIDFENNCLKVPVALEDWPQTNKPGCVSINSFGYGGSNAHVVLEEAPQSESKTVEETKWPLVFPISARQDKALEDLANRFSFFLDSPFNKSTFEDIYHSATSRRSHHSHRLAIVAEDKKDLYKKMMSFSKGDLSESIIASQIIEDNPELIFVFTGMGPQWWAMGQELMQKSPVFLKAIEKCDDLFRTISGWSLLDELKAKEEGSDISRTEIAQPTNFAIQIALVALWDSWGIKPKIVVGHSVGEVAAAYVSGALSLEDALKVSFHRSRLQQKTAGKGTMLAIGLAEAEALDFIKDEAGVSVAAINSPSGVAIAGDKKALDNIAALCKKSGHFNKFLKVEVAYHSHQMEEIKEEILDVLSDIKPQQTKIPLYSTVTGELTSGQEWGNEYWWNNVRQPVRFAKAITSILKQTKGCFLEIGPHPVLGASIKETAALMSLKPEVIHSLNRKKPEQHNMLQALGQLHCFGFDVDWSNFMSEDCRFVTLPNYPWQKERYWSVSKQSQQEMLGQPGPVFFNEDLESPFPSWEVEINDQFFPHLADHQINNRVVFPGAEYVEIALALHEKIYQKQACTIENLEFHKMLIVESELIQKLRVIYHPEDCKFHIYSCVWEAEPEWELYASGKIITNSINHSMGSKKRTDAIKNMTKIDTEHFYQTLEKRGNKYGSSFQNVKDLWQADNKYLIDIEMSLTDQYPEDEYKLFSPLLLDSAFQCVLEMAGGTAALVPVWVKRILFYATPTDKCWCQATVIERTKNSIEVDMLIYDTSGHLLIDLRGLNCQVLNQSQDANKLFYNFDWQKAQLLKNANNTKDKKCLIYANESKFSKSLLSTLENQCVSVDLIKAQDSSQDIKEAIKELDFDHVIYLWPVKDNNEWGDDIVSDILDSVTPIMHFIQCIEAEKPDVSLQLSIVTRHAQLVDQDENLNVSEASLWGLGMLIQNEHPNFKCKNIDIDDTTNIQHIINEIFKETESSDTAYRSDQRFIKSLNLSTENDDEKLKNTCTITKNPVALVPPSSGNLDNLIYEEVKRVEPSAYEVELEVHASSLNYKDVLKAQGKLPAKVTQGTFFADSIGMECSGKIVKLGDKIGGLKIGDEVVAAAKGSFKSYVTVSANQLLKKLSGLDLIDAPIYAVFLAAYYGLVKVAQLKEGEKVLIHNATGGVGLAAIQIAKWLNADIYATAGTKEKRQYLNDLGVKLVMDSRSLNFVEEIKVATDRQGLDVVINAISGEALFESFALLKEHGRFIELGKRDIANNSSLPMAAFNRNITFSAIDIDRMFDKSPDTLHKIASEINTGFEKGYFKALPSKVFAAADTAEAFTFMADNKHMGKVVVNMKDQEVSAIPLSAQKEIVKKNASYLITGGTSGFGLELAKWLAEKGAGQLILLSRSGVKTDEAKKTVEAIKALGAKVLAPKVDVTSLNEIKKVIDDIQSGPWPLLGIFHGAMVLDDDALVNLDRSRFEKVLRPKVTGAWNLHQLSKDLDLEHFVCFSSISSLIGNKQQANYIVANSFLDNLAHYRQSLGLPSLTINWGALGDTGVVARDKDLRAWLNSQGISALSNSEAFTALERAMKYYNGQLGLFEVDWSRWPDLNDSVSKSSRFQNLVTLANNDSNNKNELYKQLNALTSHEEKIDCLQNLLRDQLASVLRLPADRIAMTQDMTNLGIDSLMSVELILTIKESLGLRVSNKELEKNSSIAKLAEKLLSKISEADASDE